MAGDIYNACQDTRWRQGTEVKDGTQGEGYLGGTGGQGGRQPLDEKFPACLLLFRGSYNREGSFHSDKFLNN